jgi:ABC-type amino acid transport substrate-binding protein
VQDGSSAVEAVQKDEADAKSIKELKKFGDNVTALMDLSAGRLDALVVDEVVGRYYTPRSRASTAFSTRTSAPKTTASARARTTPS